MKRAIIYVTTCFCIVFSVMMSIVTETNVGADTLSDKGTIFVNNVKLDTVDTIVIDNDEMQVPLRTVLEALGSTVIWEKSTGNVYFDYAGVVYVCRFKMIERENFSPLYFVLICNVANINSERNDDYIQLNQMSADGSYHVINDRIYLRQQTAQRLFESLGCKVDIDIEQNILSITTVTP